MKIEKWEILELSFEGKKDGNPFTDYEIKGIFKSKNETKEIYGFYDGDGNYKIRFMPSFEGEYTYKIFGNFSEKEDNGSFIVTENSKNNHGPVHVANTYHLAYEDGTPYYSIGTTCYAWTHQKEDERKETIKTLEKSPFNKIRFCVYPKHYDYNLYEPITYPYVGTPCSIEGINKNNFNTYLPSNPENNWDFNTFNVDHFKILDEAVENLKNLGIEADIILMHPYDRWGFSQMSLEHCTHYLKYMVARYSAYRNVWWSLANEYDLCPSKTIKDWESYADTIVTYDIYNRLRSIHNCGNIYDFTRPWITHCSLQRTEIYMSVNNTIKWREMYKKPIILDEVGYEGNIDHVWGSLSPKEMTRLFWATTIKGGYCGHGETYVHPEDKLWWSHGITLHGQSVERLSFLKKILDEIPAPGLKPFKLRGWDESAATCQNLKYENKYFLFYTDRMAPSFKRFNFDDTNTYVVELIDTWEMTIENLGEFKGQFQVQLPSKEYMLLRIRNKEIL